MFFLAGEATVLRPPCIVVYAGLMIRGCGWEAAFPVAGNRATAIRMIDRIDISVTIA
jgi:hypothetical protein